MLSLQILHGRADPLGFWETAPYPSPKPTFGPKREVSVDVDLGEG